MERTLKEFERFEPHIDGIISQLSQKDPEAARDLRKEFLAIAVQARKLYHETHATLRGETGLTDLIKPQIKLPQLPTAETGKIQLQTPKDDVRLASEHTWLKVLTKAGDPYSASADPKDPLAVVFRIQYHYPISQCLSFSPATAEVSLARKRNDGLLVLTTADISYSDPKNRKKLTDIRIVFPDKTQATIKHLAKISETEVVFATATAIYSIQDYTKEAFVIPSKEKTATKFMIPHKPDGLDKWQIDEILGGVPFVSGLGFFLIPSIKDKNLELSWPTFNNGNGITKQVAVATAAPADKKKIPSLVKYLDAHSFAASPTERKSFVFVLSSELKEITVFNVNAQSKTVGDAKTTKIDPAANWVAETLYVSDHTSRVFVLFRDPTAHTLLIKGYKVTLKGDELVFAVEEKLDVAIPKLNGNYDPNDQFANQFALGVFESYQRLHFFVFSNSGNKVISGVKEPNKEPQMKIKRLFDLDSELETKLFASDALKDYGYVHRVYSHKDNSNKEHLAGVLVQTPNWKNKDGTQCFSTLFTISPKY